MQTDILQPQPVHLPECLVSIQELHILQFHVSHLTEELRGINTTTTHHKVIGIPDSRTGIQGEIAVLYQGTVNMPPRVLPIETAMTCLNVLTLFDTTLAVCDGDILQSRVMNGEQRPFSTKLFVFNQFQ